MAANGFGPMPAAYSKSDCSQLGSMFNGMGTWLYCPVGQYNQVLG
jgi:hypothetical protein